MKVTKEYVEDILARTGLPEQDKERILAMDYPVDRDEMIRLFASMGIGPDVLTSRMGGSP